MIYIVDMSSQKINIAIGFQTKIQFFSKVNGSDYIFNINLIYFTKNGFEKAYYEKKHYILYPMKYMSPEILINYYSKMFFLFVIYKI